MHSPIENVLARLRELGLDPKERRSSDPNIVAQYDARCPAHDDRKASLRIAVTRDGRVLTYCHARCPTDVVVARLGFEMSGLGPGNDRGAVGR